MYRVHLDQFEGPLDLLLFFIRRDELDIFNIPIAAIADEYLRYVQVLEELDLDAAADFVYMAALLISIKAKLLLPRPELDDHGDPIDPRRELVERLLEYIRYKEAASLLDTRRTAREELFAWGGGDAERARLAEPTEVSYRLSLFDLVRVLKEVLEQEPEPVIHPVLKYEYTLDEQRAYVLSVLTSGPTPFRTLARGPVHVPANRAFIIVTFLALLDLMQQQLVLVTLREGPTDFDVTLRVPSEGDGSPLALG